METYYKILRNGRSCHGGKHTWEPGVTYEVAEVIPCVSGFHACRLEDLARWLTHDMEIWEIELSEVVVEYNKVVGKAARLTKRLGKLTREKQVEFARWCAGAAATAVSGATTNDRAGAAAYAARNADRAANRAAVYAARADADRATAEAAVNAAICTADAAYAAATYTVDAATAYNATCKAQGQKILELLVRSEPA